MKKKPRMTVSPGGREWSTETANRARQKCRALTLDDLTIARLQAIGERYNLGGMSATVRFLAATAAAAIEAGEFVVDQP